MRDVLRAIDRGETVTVFYRGKERAKLMPSPPAPGASRKDTPKTEDQPLFGLWSDRDDLTDPAAYVRNLREPRQVAARAHGTKPPGARKPR
jgi:hypothetical protein